MNPVVMRVTARSLVGGRRGVLLMILPAVTLAVALAVRLWSGGDVNASADLLNILALGILVPLTCLLIGTGAIGSEIEDGSIVYVLSKPLPRWHIAVSKLTVAYAAALLLVVIPTALAALIAGDENGLLASGVAVSAGLAAIAYVSLFFWLGIVARNAVVIGLIYALMWETTLGTAVPGVRNLSIRQWALSWGEEVVGGAWGIRSDVEPVVGAVLLAVTVIACVALAASALSRLQPRPRD